MLGKKLLVESPGSAVKEWQMELRQALLDGVTPEDVQAIAKGLVEKAKAGDQGAIKLLFTYVLGGSSVNIRQGVVIQEQPRQPEPHRGPGRPPNGHAKRPLIPDDLKRGGDWLVLGVKPDGERVLLTAEASLAKATAARDNFAEQLEDYKDVVVERMTPT